MALGSDIEEPSKCLDGGASIERSTEAATIVQREDGRRTHLGLQTPNDGGCRSPERVETALGPGNADEIVQGVECTGEEWRAQALRWTEKLGPRACHVRDRVDSASNFLAHACR